MGSESAPTPPSYNSADTLRQGSDQTAQTVSALQQIVPLLGNLQRTQNTGNTKYSLRMLTDPGSVLYAGELGKATKGQAATQKRLDGLGKWKSRTTKAGAVQYYNPNAKAWVSEDRYNQLKTTATTKLGEYSTQIGEIKDRPIKMLKDTFADQFAARDGLLASMKGAGASTAEYTRAQDAYGRGITAQETEAGALGDRLMQTAMAKMDQGGQLSPEASRDAVQSARSGMAARGLATSGAGLAAEFLNRDRYSRQREFENLGFARGVQTEDLGRRQGNAQMRDNTNRYNMGLLGTSAQMADAERMRQMGVLQDSYNFGMQTDPRMLIAGLGSPLANMTSMGTNLSQTNLQPVYSGENFSNKGPGLHTQISGIVGGAFGAYYGGPAGAAAGYQAGTSLGQATEGSFADPTSYFSDERMKTDIKPLGKVTSLLDLPAYEYRYKGEKKKRKGVMAQDVQKVLPEAVTEVDYQGKRRLAIKPGVIGAALAEELTNQTKAVAA